jgi:hypothetical protein
LCFTSEIKDTESSNLTIDSRIGALNPSAFNTMEHEGAQNAHPNNATSYSLLIGKEIHNNSKRSKCVFDSVEDVDTDSDSDWGHNSIKKTGAAINNIQSITFQHPK